MDSVVASEAIDPGSTPGACTIRNSSSQSSSSLRGDYLPLLPDRPEPQERRRAGGRLASDSFFRRLPGRNDIGVHAVADAGLCQEKSRPVGIVLELPPETGHVHPQVIRPLLVAGSP